MRTPTLGRILKGLAALVALAIVLLLVLPDGRYILRGAWEELGILRRRRPIAEIVADSATSPEVRRRLQLVLDARQFAMTHLGLAAKESFTTYSTVKHDTLVLVLTAAYRDRLQPVRWWFPIVGHVPYKGFFDFATARRTRDDFERRGFDTSLGASSAFSTLGWFNDPLLNTTLRRDTIDLANTVIHELTHNTVFVKSQVEFNESFASFVGAKGAAAFFRQRGSDTAATRAELEWEDDKQLSRFWSMVVKAVDSAYKQHPSDSAARVQARDSVFARSRRVLIDEIGPGLKTIPRASLERARFNNATLLARRAYAHDLWVFDEVYRKMGGDLRRMIAEIKERTSSGADPFDALKELAEGRGQSRNGVRVVLGSKSKWGQGSESKWGQSGRRGRCS
jgi:predicted aminopeptidase